MKTILKLAAAIATVACLFAGEPGPQPGSETESDEWNLGEFEETLAAVLAATHGGYCLSYVDKVNRRWIYLTSVFLVDIDSWRNVADDRPATERELSRQFESDYADWLSPRFERVFLHKTHCWMFGVDTDVDKRREQEAEDFRELGHRVVDTNWSPTFILSDFQDGLEAALEAAEAALEAVGDDL